jgi:hypothetical protein
VTSFAAAGCSDAAVWGDVWVGVQGSRKEAEADLQVGIGVDYPHAPDSPADILPGCISGTFFHRDGVGLRAGGNVPVLQTLTRPLPRHCAAAMS